MSQQHEQAQEKKYPVGVSAKFAAGTIVASLPFDLLAHLGPTGFLVGGLASYVAFKHGPEVYEHLRGMIPALPPLEQALAAGDQDNQVDTTGKLTPAQQKRSRSFWDRAMGRFPEGYFDSEEDDQVQEGDQQASSKLDTDDAGIFAQLAASTEVPGIQRITVDQMVRHVARNSYEVFIGRSLTGPGNRAVKVNFFKRHIKFIGASQHGKSSMVGALIEAIMRTHDPEKVMFSLLDLENKTSRLFADSDHIAEILIGDTYIPLHARSPQEVLQHLEYLLRMVEYRYTLPEQEIDELPLLIVYLEEFLVLKDHFKLAILDAKTNEQKEDAKRDYERLLHCIRQLARMGLKVHVQMFLCAQVDYADDDLKEALANITSGMAFCVKPSAARSAGFLQEKLMSRNAQDDKVGQCVVEMPECKDLILAPYYPLRDKLKALGKPIHPIHPSPVALSPELKSDQVNQVKVNAVNAVNEPEKPVNAQVNASESSPSAENDSPNYTQAEEVQVLLAYAEMLQAGTPITRSGIRDYLKWNSKHFSRIVKPVCDKHHIAEREA